MRSSPRPSVAPPQRSRRLVAVPAPDRFESSLNRSTPSAGRIVLVAAVLLLGLALAVASGVPTAGAHSILVRTDPAPGDQLDGLEAVRLEFAHAVSDSGHVVALHRDGVEVAVASAYELPEPNTVVARFDPALPAGDHEIVWDVVAGDGHHERGRIPITLRAPTTDAAADPLEDDGTTGSTGSVEPAAGVDDGASGVDDGASGDGSGGGPFVLRLAIAAAVLAAFVYWRRRRLARPRPGPPLDRP